jgi:hypothetical protein
MIKIFRRNKIFWKIFRTEKRSDRLFEVCIFITSLYDKINSTSKIFLHFTPDLSLGFL